MEARVYYEETEHVGSWLTAVGSIFIVYDIFGEV